MVKALRKKRLLSQRTGAEDTRVRIVTVTQSGVELLASAIPMMGGLQSRLWPTGSELPQLLQTIHTTLARWEAGDERKILPAIGVRPRKAVMLTECVGGKERRSRVR